MNEKPLLVKVISYLKKETCPVERAHLSMVFRERQELIENVINRLLQSGVLEAVDGGVRLKGSSRCLTFCQKVLSVDQRLEQKKLHILVSETLRALDCKSFLNIEFLKGLLVGEGFDVDLVEEVIKNEHRLGNLRCLRLLVISDVKPNLPDLLPAYYFSHYFNVSPEEYEKIKNQIDANSMYDEGKLISGVHSAQFLIELPGRGKELREFIINQLDSKKSGPSFTWFHPKCYWYELNVW